MHLSRLGQRAVGILYLNLFARDQVEMKQIPPFPIVLPGLQRRRLLQGLAAGGVIFGVSPWIKSAWAKEAATDIATGSARMLSGTESDLLISATPVNYTGVPRMATPSTAPFRPPVLHWREGDTVTIRVTDRMNVPTSIRWHGIILPYQMDGVPGVSFKGIAPGESFNYRFKVQQAGTFGTTLTPASRSKPVCTRHRHRTERRTEHPRRPRVESDAHEPYGLG